MARSFCTPTLAMRWPAIFTMMLAIVLSAAATLEAATEESLIIRNVRLVDHDGKAEDRTVTLVIEDGELKLVTTDEVESEGSQLVIDALGGVLLGTLHVGRPANLMILDGDPREDFTILLDTHTHAVLAMHDGTLVKNQLETVRTAEPPVKRKPRWIAYTPPPMALPISYQDGKKWNAWETKAVSGIFIAGVFLDRTNWTGQDEASREQVGDLNDYGGGEIRGFRLGAVGTLNFKRPWIYTFFAATNAFDKGFDTTTTDDFSLFDWRLDIPLTDEITVGVGKQKEPISQDRIAGGAYLPMQERASFLDAMLPSRNVGVTINGSSFGKRMSWAFGWFNDWFDASQSYDESASQLVGRVTALAAMADDESQMLHLGLGVRHTDAKEGVQYLTEPEINQAPLFVDTGHFQAESSLVYDIEAAWLRGPILVNAEYLRNEVDAPAMGDPIFTGYHITASYILTGEKRSYNRRNGTFGPVPVAQSVYQGGKGAWELGARYSTIDLTEGLVNGGEMDILSLGANWFLTRYFAVSLNYRHVTLDRDGIVGRSNGINTRLLLMLE